MSDPKRYSYSLDNYSGSKHAMRDPSSLVGTVYKVARVAGMTILNVIISEIDEDLKRLGSPIFEDEGGISVLALISTSHIALHCWPARRYFMFDIVSCRPFNKEEVDKLIKDDLDVCDSE